MRAALWLLAVAMGCAGAGAATPPPALEPWQDWVADGLEHLDCPWLSSGGYDQADQHLCAWPEPLSIEVDGQGARFRQRWQVFAETQVPLLGDARTPPQTVRVDGQAQAVLGDNDAPSVRLAPGRYEITGALIWRQRPSDIRVPGAVGLIDLRIDGVLIPTPRRENERLWLGESADSRRGPDSLNLRIYRELRDDMPMQLITHVQIDVGGRAREATFGPALPPGFVASALGGDLPAVLQSDGRLRVQLRPGAHRLVLHARSDEVATRFAAANAEAPWPAEEVWGYRADPRLRTSIASGGAAIDPGQAGAPWSDLPSFVLGAEQSLDVTESARGLGEAQANRLNVQRQLWLDFGGQRWLSRDHIDGSLLRDWRLDAHAPWQLLSARADGEPALITQHGDREGIELRQPALNVEAQMSMARGELPASGWNQPVEALHMRLNLPPGYRLLAAPGADAAPQAWLSRFNLLDVFLIGLAALLAGRWLGWGFGVLVAGYALLVWHEPGAPRLLLLPLFALTLLAAHLTRGRLGALVRGLRNGVLLLAVLLALPFAANQLAYALYPQLEGGGVHQGSVAARLRSNALLASKAPQAVEELNAPPRDMDYALAPAAPPPPPAPVMQEQTDRIQARRSRIKHVEPLQNYAPDAMPQSGLGLPDWQWQSYSLSWNGPVLPEQTVRPWLLSAWMLSLLRVLMVALLALILARSALSAWTNRAQLPARWRWLVAAGLLLPGLALAQATPAPELLTELRNRLIKAPDCAPICLRVERAEVAINDRRLRLTVDVHAGHAVALPLPFDAEALATARISRDGAPLPARWRDGESLWLPVAAGVQRIVLDADLVGDRLALRFAMPPAQLAVNAPGWQTGGLNESRLQGDTLQLLRESSDSTASAGAADRQRFAPYVRVLRELRLDLDWDVIASAQRLAPVSGGFEVTIPLLPGEQVLSEDAGTIADGAIALAFAADEHEQGWRSRLTQTPDISLTAPAMARHVEVWRVIASPWWHVEIEGLPAVLPEPLEDGGLWVHEFHPLPGETLRLRVTRPEAVAGATLAIDRASLITRSGQRARDHHLTLSVRATRGGAQVLSLPEAAEVIALNVDGDTLELRPENGRLTLPLTPGEHQVQLSLRENVTGLAWQRPPTLGLGAAAANLDWQLELPRDRWLLWTQGPRLGPAVLYWPLLGLLLVVAWLLARSGRTPLRVWHWLLLGLGFSTFAWWGFALVAVWLLLLDWRQRLLPASWSPRHFRALQVGLAALTAIAVLVLIVSVPFHLLGDPDMQVVGNGSSAQQLRWFHDASADGAWFNAAALSAPLWLYKLAMLAWALWLASALIGWLRWAWSALRSGGFWHLPTPDASAKAAVSE